MSWTGAEAEIELRVHERLRCFSQNLFSDKFPKGICMCFSSNARRRLSQRLQDPFLPPNFLHRPEYLSPATRSSCTQSCALGLSAHHSCFYLHNLDVCVECEANTMHFSFLSAATAKFTFARHKRKEQIWYHSPELACKEHTQFGSDLSPFMFPRGSLVPIGFILWTNPMSLAHNVVSMFADMFSCHNGYLIRGEFLAWYDLSSLFAPCTLQASNVTPIGFFRTDRTEFKFRFDQRQENHLKVPNEPPADEALVANFDGFLSPGN